MILYKLPKFIKKNPEVKTKLEQWLWAISGKGDKAKMAEKTNKDVKEAMNIVKEMSMSDEEWELYESRRLALLDYNTGMINAKNEGVKEEKIKIAKQLLKMGMTIKQIKEATKLSEEEIKKITQEQQN